MAQWLPPTMGLPTGKDRFLFLIDANIFLCGHHKDKLFGVRHGQSQALTDAEAHLPPEPPGNWGNSRWLQSPSPPSSSCEDSSGTPPHHCSSRLLCLRSVNIQMGPQMLLKPPEIAQISVPHPHKGSLTTLSNILHLEFISSIVLLTSDPETLSI